MKTVVRDHGELVRMVRGGATGSEVARQLGVSRQRVQQIWAKETGEPLPGLPDAICRMCGTRGPRINESTEHKASFEHVTEVVARDRARFWARIRMDGPIPVERPELGPCWTYAGAHYPTGYAHSRQAGQGYAHRAIYSILVGSIPDGLTIDHLCRNRGCVNPTHLEAVTQRDNTLRSPIARAAVNARKTHCKWGHEFSLENTRFGGPGNRSRACRACARVRTRAERVA